MRDRERKKERKRGIKKRFSAGMQTLKSLSMEWKLLFLS